MKISHFPIRVNWPSLFGAIRTSGALLTGNAVLIWLTPDKGFLDVWLLLFLGTLAMILGSVEKDSA